MKIPDQTYDGKAMKAGTDYEKEISYTYAMAARLENGETKKAGDIVNETDIIPAGTTVKVSVKGIGSYQGNVTGEYRIIAKENDISKAKITLKTPQYYTGLSIRPDEKQFEVKLGEKEYGGTKTVKFAIRSKPIGAIEKK